jgi:hypothetical protein
MRSIFALVLTTGALLTACTGAGGPRTPQVARVEVTPGGALLTAAGQSKTLSATAYDSNGNTLEVPVSWASSDGVVSVSQSGVATSTTELGSAQVIASAGGVQSAPALVVVANPAPGAVLVSDAQVLGGPTLVNAGEEGVGSRVSLTIAGIGLPTVGTVLLASESRPVAGKVVSASATGGDTAVVLEVVPLGDLFQHLKVTTQGRLAQADPASVSAAARPTATSRLPNGGLRLQYAPKVLVRPSLAGEHEFEMGPFECTATVAVNPRVNAITIEIGHTIDYGLEIDIEDRVVQRWLTKASGELGVKGNIGISLGATFEGGIECDAPDLLNLPIPSGPLTGALGAYIPLGTRLALSGKLQATALEVGLQGEAKGGLTLGFDYTPAGGFQNLSQFTHSLKGGPKFTMPPDQPDFKIEAGFAVLARAGISFGMARVFGLEMLEASVGPKLKAELKPLEQQLLDDLAASKYEVKFSGEIGPGEDLANALRLVLSPSIAAGLVNTISLSIGSDLLLASSPTGSASVDRASFEAGDSLHFQVKLDPENRNFFPGVYNVDKIRIYRRLPGANNRPTVVMIAERAATTDQIDFSLEWIASGDGTVGNNFFAVVIPSFLSFSSLELGSVLPGVDPCPTNATAVRSLADQCEALVVTPASITLTPGDTKQFAASIGGQATTSVTWTSSGGSIAQTGWFTAPSQAGAYTIRATSNSNPAVFAEAIVTVSLEFCPVLTVSASGQTKTQVGFTQNLEVGGVNGNAVVGGTALSANSIDGGTSRAALTIYATVNAPSLADSFPITLSFQANANAYNLGGTGSRSYSVLAKADGATILSLAGDTEFGAHEGKTVRVTPGQKLRLEMTFQVSTTGNVGMGGGMGMTGIQAPPGAEVKLIYCN